MLNFTVITYTISVFTLLMVLKRDSVCLVRHPANSWREESLYDVSFIILSYGRLCMSVHTVQNLNIFQLLKYNKNPRV